MYWNEEYELMTRDEISQLQIERLQSTLNRVYKNVPYYKKLFDDKGIIPEEINSLDDLRQIPFTTKDTLRENYPYGMFAVPLREVVRIHSSSGTTGKATVVGYTRNDLKHWSELMARVLVSVGVTKDDKVQIAFDYGLFTGGFGFHYGSELIGASVVPTSTAAPEKQIHIMRDYKTTILACSPSFAISIFEKMKALGIDPNELVLKTGIFGSEPWSEKIREQLQKSFYIDAYDTYGLSEIMGPGVASECIKKCGLHLFEDHYIAEIINPDTGDLLPHGETGELVLTTITKEAVPMIRYRTGDLTSLIDEPCSCGRKTLRLSRISGRSDDMFVIHGTKILPAQIGKILSNVEHCEPHYKLIIGREGGMDELEIQVEVSESIPFDEVKTLMKIQEKIKERIFEEFSIHVRIKLVEPKTIQRSNGKASPVIDNRGE
jgi:phenylacetate-CoA ligase